MYIFVCVFGKWKVISYFECDNQAAVDSLTKEKEARTSIERSQASLSEELEKVQGELDGANQRVKYKTDNLILSKFLNAAFAFSSLLLADTILERCR